MSFLQSTEQKSTILITGGASGIGFSLAKRFIALGHKVIVCGRRQEQLALAKIESPSLTTIQADVSTDAGRKALFEKVTTDYPDINVLINNAGIALGEPVPLKDTTEADWALNKVVIATNLEAPIHLCMLFLPKLLALPNSLIANVSSLGAFIPFGMYPTYCSTKAGLHSFTQCLRQQCKGISVQVVEILPPAVDTDIAPASHKPLCMNVEDYTADTLAQLVRGVQEIGYDSELFPSSAVLRGSRDYLDEMFDKFNGNSK